MLSFHTPKWAKIHEDFRQIIQQNYDAEEFAKTVQGTRQAVALLTVLEAQKTGDPQVVSDAKTFLDLWFENMNRTDIEFRLTYMATATWAWEERR